MISHFLFVGPSIVDTRHVKLLVVTQFENRQVWFRIQDTGLPVNFAKSSSTKRIPRDIQLFKRYHPLRH